MIAPIRARRSNMYPSSNPKGYYLCMVVLFDSDQEVRGLKNWRYWPDPPRPLHSIDHAVNVVQRPAFENPHNAQIVSALNCRQSATTADSNRSSSVSTSCFIACERFVG